MINDLLKIYYQKSLIRLSLDEQTASALLLGYLGGQYGGNPGLWREAVVEFLYKNYCARLIEIIPADDRLDSNFDANSLRTVLYPIPLEADIIFWNGIQFFGTEKLKKILDATHLQSWEAWHENAVNESFIKRIEAEYDLPKI